MIKDYLLEGISGKVPESDEYKEPLTSHYLPSQSVIKDTHKENAPTSKTQALTEEATQRCSLQKMS